MADGLQVTELIAGQPKHSTSLFTAGISRFPTTPGQHIVVIHSSYLFALDDADLSGVLHFTYQFANEVKSVTKVKRCGLAYDGHQCLHVIPMHGLNEDWKPILAPDTELEETYPGYLWTKSSPHMDEDALGDIQERLARASGWTAPDHTFLGDRSDDNLFARLTRGQIPQWRFWEDSQHLAFLTPFANTPGNTVLIPRRHLPSDIFGLQKEEFDDLMDAAKKVVGVLQTGLGVRRVGMFFEGFEIDYTHVKFVPLMGEHELEGPSDEYHETYPGYITTRLGPEEENTAKLEVYRQMAATDTR